MWPAELTVYVACLVYPGAEVLSIADSCRHGQKLDVRGAIDDDLLPHAAAGRVAQVVHLVQHQQAHISQPLDRP